MRLEKVVKEVDKKGTHNDKICHLKKDVLASFIYTLHASSRSTVVSMTREERVSF